EFLLAPQGPGLAPDLREDPLRLRQEAPRLVPAVPPLRHLAAVEEGPRLLVSVRRLPSDREGAVEMRFRFRPAVLEGVQPGRVQLECADAGPLPEIIEQPP